MTWWEAVAILAAGVGAGTINTIVGSGTLITFPTLLAFGYAPVTASISNSIGLVPGGVSGTWGYRPELTGQRRFLLRLAPASLLGAVTGATLLLSLPEEAFARIVPVLLAVSVALVIVQPRLQRFLQARREARDGAARPTDRSIVAIGGTYLAGVYGGYFGAAQGVLLIGILGSLLPEPLQRVNALKNVLQVTVNSTAAIFYTAAAFGRVNWAVVGLISIGSLLGGLVGARIGRRLPAPVLRTVIVVVGVIAIWRIVS